MADAWLDKVIDTFSAGKCDGSFSDQLWAEACQGAAKLESLLEAAGPARILDLACGSGSMTIALALRGHQMTGIDCTPTLLETARRQSDRKGVAVDWRCEDMRSLEEQDAYDFVFLRDVVFSIFETPAEDTEMLHRMAAAVKRGGKCLFEVYNKPFAITHGVEGTLSYDERQDRFVNLQQPSGLRLRLYSQQQWERMLAGVGLHVVKWHGWSWPNDPDAPPHRANIIVAQRT